MAVTKVPDGYISACLNIPGFSTTSWRCYICLSIIILFSIPPAQSVDPPNVFRYTTICSKSDSSPNSGPVYLDPCSPTELLYIQDAVVFETEECVGRHPPRGPTLFRSECSRRLNSGDFSSQCNGKSGRCPLTLNYSTNCTTTTSATGRAAILKYICVQQTAEAKINMCVKKTHVLPNSRFTTIQGVFPAGRSDLPQSCVCNIEAVGIPFNSPGPARIEIRPITFSVQDQEDCLHDGFKYTTADRPDINIVLCGELASDAFSFVQNSADVTVELYDNADGIAGVGVYLNVDGINSDFLKLTCDLIMVTEPPPSTLPTARPRPPHENPDSPNTGETAPMLDPTRGPSTAPSIDKSTRSGTLEETPPRQIDYWVIIACAAGAVLLVCLIIAVSIRYWKRSNKKSTEKSSSPHNTGSFDEPWMKRSSKFIRSSIFSFKDTNHMKKPQHTMVDFAHEEISPPQSTINAFSVM